jgi:hypothetical protein
MPYESWQRAADGRKMKKIVKLASRCSANFTEAPYREPESAWWDIKRPEEDVLVFAHTYTSDPDCIALEMKSIIVW